LASACGSNLPRGDSCDKASGQTQRRVNDGSSKQAYRRAQVGERKHTSTRTYCVDMTAGAAYVRGE
jgi:hypothetical protein